ncbi:MAG: hypothetical protein BWK80_20225 [Desulfobacteraceae bacterium IS3]|jgi:hypothetical protein|nr:MAG: hypothetical protein BWK80_20225 [Desulfobacteraceae bacterium IS3]HAO21249.1 hypothetical protein [Desulfobacteraceae bacterium]
MELKEFDVGAEDAISMALTAAAYLISPILFIWSVNTLFNCRIELSFKTWLAGFIMLMLLRFHLRGAGSSGEPYYEYDDEDISETTENDDDDAEQHRQRNRGKLIPYQDHKNKRKLPPDGT